MNDPIEGFNQMSEIDRIEAERKLLDTAFRNSYKIITGKLTFENIIEETGQFLIAHNPDKIIKKDDLINMMSYFTETEEYEKCAKIRDIIKTHKEEKQEIYTQGINNIFDKFIKKPKK